MQIENILSKCKFMRMIFAVNVPILHFFWLMSLYMHSGEPLKLNYAFDVNQNCSNNCWGSHYLTRSAGRAHRVPTVGIYIPNLHRLQLTVTHLYILHLCKFYNLHITPVCWNYITSFLAFKKQLMVSNKIILKQSSHNKSYQRTFKL